jgi:hypothetical protein
MIHDTTFEAASYFANGYTREQAKMSIGAGWHTLIDMVYDKRSTMQHPPMITQVKEKFGGLRIYYSYPHDDTSDFEDLVIRVEKQSYTVCEDCGQPGTLRSGGWFKTLCDTHANGRPSTTPF